MQIKVRIIKYKYDLSNLDDEKAYKILTAKMKSREIKPVESLVTPKYGEYYKKIRKEEIIDSKYLFENQFNTVSGLRLFFWSEIQYGNNHHMREGYYVADDEDFKKFKNLLDGTFKCRYCGKNYPPGELPEDLFCTNCIGNELLLEDELWRLKLYPITKKEDNSKILIHGDLKDKHHRIKAQKTIERNRRLMDKHLEEKKKKLKLAKLEYNIFKFLYDFNMPLDNAIFYDHNQTLCFGWHHKMEDREIYRIRTILERENVKWKWEFKNE